MIVNGQLIDTVDLVQRTGRPNRLIALTYFVNTTTGRLDLNLRNRGGMVLLPFQACQIKSNQA